MILLGFLVKEQTILIASFFVKLPTAFTHSK
jgi:hypothetical protein